MFFRFSAALILIVMVSMTSVMIEKRTLELRRQISRQYYHTDLLIELQVRLRLETQTLTAPAQLAELRSDQSGEDTAQQNTGRQDRNGQGTGRRTARRNSEHENTSPLSSDEGVRPRLPLLRFQEPFRPEGID